MSDVLISDLEDAAFYFGGYFLKVEGQKKPEQYMLRLILNF